MKYSRTFFVLALASTLSGAFAASAHAETQWQKDHPRRAEVNGRLANQNKRITKEVKEGEITKQQALGLRANDKAIRGQERADAAQNGGHITKAQQSGLNQELNQNSKAIGK